MKCPRCDAEMKLEGGRYQQHGCRVPEHICVYQESLHAWQVGLPGISDRSYAFGKSQVDGVYYIILGGQYLYRGSDPLDPKMSLSKLKLYNLFS